jgi:hypothetical protein
MSGLADYATYYWRVRATNAGGTSDWSSVWRFTTVDTTPPEVTLITPPTEAPEGIALPISISATDKGTIGTTILYYRKGGERIFTTLPMGSSGTGVYTGTIPTTGVSKQGVEYYVLVEDGAGNRRTEPGTDPEGHPRTVRVTFTNFTGPEDLPFNQWRMISIPFEITVNPFISTVLAVLGAYDKTKWRLFQYDAGYPVNNGYREYDGAGNLKFTPGKAFWLHTRTPNARLRIETGKTVDTAQPFEVPLQPGWWDDIGVPFAFPVAWSEILRESGDPVGVMGPYAYTGTSWTFPGTVPQLEPYQGYAVKNLNTTPVTLRIPARAGGAARTAKPLVTGEGEWLLHVGVELEGSEDTGNIIGIHRSARPDWDPEDYPEPPPTPGGGISLYFPHLNWDQYPDRYTSDLRPAGEMPTTWEMVVEADRSGSAVLTFQGVEHLPSEVAVRLLDGETGVVSDVREMPAYTFTLNRETLTRRFHLVAGRREEVESAAVSYRQVPEGFVLLPNAPNPFNQETAIGYQIPHRSRVRLAIYSLAGQKIVVLRHDISDPGYFTVTWDGRDMDGVEVASGVYVVILDAEGTRLAQKLLLLR